MVQNIQFHPNLHTLPQLTENRKEGHKCSSFKTTYIYLHMYKHTDIDLDILLVKAPNISFKPYICFNFILHSIKTWHGLKP